MKSEKLKALTFIVVGCFGAVALGFIVWQASSPTRPTLDIAMHTTTSTTPAPALFETPGSDPVDADESEVGNQVLAAVDTADPYLPPNAYVSPRGRKTPQSPVPEVSGTTTVPQPEPSARTSTTEVPSIDRTITPETESSAATSRTPVESDDPAPTPAPSTPQEPSAPPVTIPPVTEAPDDSDDTEDTEDSEEPTEPVFPSDPTDTEVPTLTPQPEDTDTVIPEITPDPSPTDFVDEPTAPLNPGTPAESAVSTDTMVD